MPLLKKAKKLAIFSDVHIGIHDDAAMRLLVECFEREGCDFAILNGDGHDCAAVSPHVGKARRAVLETGQLAEEIEGGRWLIEWLRTRPTIYGTGNHEDWINDLALRDNAVGTITVASALALPEGPEFFVLPQGYQIRLGSLVVEHGDITLGRSTGGQHLAANILRRYPNQTTIVGHFHHADFSVHSTPDHSGHLRSHAAHCLGHVSLPSAHSEYAGRTPNWQQGAAIVNLWQDGGRPRFTVQQIEVHRDRRNRPIFEFNGKVYK